MALRDLLRAVPLDGVRLVVDLMKKSRACWNHRKQGICESSALLSHERLIHSGDAQSIKELLGAPRRARTLWTRWSANCRGDPWRILGHYSDLDHGTIYVRISAVYWGPQVADSDNTKL